MRSTASRAAGLALATAFLSLPCTVFAAGLEAQVTAPAPAWEGQQYVGADAKGRAYVLRPKEFLVYPLVGGELGEPVKLERPSVSTPVPVLDAALEGPRDWVALFGGEVRWVRAGKEETLPELHWSPAAVTMLDGRPVVAVHPNPVGRVTERDLHPVPLLLTPNRNDWSILVESDRDEVPGRDERHEARIAGAGRLFTDSRDTLWLASTYRYRLAHYSAAGKELLVLEVDGAEIRRRDEEAVEELRAGLEEERARYSEPSKVRIAVNDALPAILDLTEGRDGMIYLLVTGVSDDGATRALDRFNAVSGLLERTPLAGSTVGAVSIAAGRDGLYIVPFNGKRQRLLIPWEAIEGAAWRPVEGVTVNGQAVRIGEAAGRE